MKILKDSDYVMVGKRFFFFTPGMSFQCAHCMFVQQTYANRNKRGRIISFYMKEEEHQNSCRQKPKLDKPKI